jgi:hypothetical protein
MEKSGTDAQIDSVDDMQEFDRSTCQSRGVEGKKSEMKRRVEGRPVDEPSSVEIVTGFCQSTMIRLSEQRKAHRTESVGSDGRVRGMRRKVRERFGEKSGDCHHISSLQTRQIEMYGTHHITDSRQARGTLRLAHLWNYRRCEGEHLSLSLLLSLSFSADPRSDRHHIVCRPHFVSCIRVP